MPGDRRSRHHRLHDRRPAGRPPGRPRSACSTTSSAAGGPTSPTPSTSGRVQVVEGDIRDVDAVRDATAGADLVFHQAAIRITQCAEEPRLALEVLADGTFNVLEAAVAGAGPQGRRRVLGLGLRAGHRVPDHRAAAPVGQRHVLRRRQGLQRGRCCAASTPCTGWTTWPCGTSTCTGRGWTSTASTPRCSSAGWSASQAGTPPLILGDGQQTMDFVFTTDIARANLLAAEADVTDDVFNIGTDTETSLLEPGRGAARGHGPRRPRRSSSARPGPSTG